jgi:hypothetical protein
MKFLQEMSGGVYLSDYSSTVGTWTGHFAGRVYGHICSRKRIAR